MSLVRRPLRWDLPDNPSDEDIRAWGAQWFKGDKLERFIAVMTPHVR